MPRLDAKRRCGLFRVGGIDIVGGGAKTFFISISQSDIVVIRTFCVCCYSEVPGYR